MKLSEWGLSGDVVPVITSTDTISRIYIQHPTFAGAVPTYKQNTVKLLVGYYYSRASL